MLNNRQNIHTYEDIISLENLLVAWKEFVAGKGKKKDVVEFKSRFMDNVMHLREDLKSLEYKHSSYYAFKISDPKPRDIHKAKVRDRLLHHAIYRQLYSFFDRKWIADSYSCRDNKGTHRAINRFRSFFQKVSKNDTRTCWVLKCDIRKFFASIDHQVLLEILNKQIDDKKIVSLLEKVIESFQSTGPGKGLPLGNLTSQLLVNVYMNEFDQFAKHKLKAHFYIRYADDFVFLSENKKALESLIPTIKDFLQVRLKLLLHPTKVSISTVASGVDFLGWVHFPTHRTLRTSTKRRMIKNIQGEGKDASQQSYRGMLSHGNAYRLSERYLAYKNGHDIMKE